MRKVITLAVTGLLLTNIAVAEVQLEGTPTELNRHLDDCAGQVNITGISERRVEADRAIIEISVQTAERSLRSAMEKNSRIRADIVKKLTDGGLPDDNITSSRFSSIPTYSMWSDKVKEYRISSSIRIYADAEKDILLSAELVDAMDAVSLTSLTFETTNRKKITRELLEEALRQINERKDLYEDSLSTRLHPRKIALLGSDSTEPNTQWLLKDKRKTSYSSMSNSGKYDLALHALEMNMPKTSRFGETVYKVGIVVTFDLVTVRDLREGLR